MIEAILEFFGLIGPEAKTIKFKILTSGFIRRKMSKILKYKPSSVFIGRIKRKKLFIGHSDRACVIGPPGTGKTTFLINQIYYWIASGNSFICLDIKPEIMQKTIKRLNAEGYTVITYNPTNVKGRYNFLGDLDSLESISELANAFIGNESSNPVFAETARDLLNAIILHIKEPTKNTPDPQPSLSGVYDFIVKAKTMKELLTVLSHSNSAECRAIANGLSIMGENERLLGSVFATFSANLRFLRLPSIRDSLSAKGFSFSELLKPKTALFLQFEEVNQATTSRFFSVMVGHLLRYMIMENQNKRPVLMMLDEIGNAEVVHDLAGKLNTMRSRNLPTWLYWQSIEQMQKYGKVPGEGANIILGACDLNMTFRLNDNATREYFANKVGTQQVTKVSVSQGVSSSSKEIQNVIEPYELGELDQHMALYSYRGDYWIGRATPYFEEK